MKLVKPLLNGIGLGIMALFCLSACSGEPLINASQSAFPFEASVNVIHHPQENPDGSFPDLTVLYGKTLTTNLGFEITLHEATVSWQHLDLISGGVDPDCESGHDRHFDLDATEDLIGEDLLLSHIDHFGVEDRAYCQWEITLGPGGAAHVADAGTGDGLNGNLTDFHTDETFFLDGEWVMGLSNGTFTISSHDEVVISDVFKALVDGSEEEHPIHFHDGETELTLIFGIKYDLLFENVDFELDSPAEIEAQILNNLANEVHQHLGEHL